MLAVLWGSPQPRSRGIFDPTSGRFVDFLTRKPVAEITNEEYLERLQMVHCQQFGTKPKSENSFNLNNGSLDTEVNTTPPSSSDNLTTKWGSYMPYSSNTDVTPQAEQRKAKQRKAPLEAEQKKEASEAEQKTEASEAVQNKDASEAERKTEASEAERKSEASEAERKTEASEAERKTEASEAERKTEASEAERKTEASEAERKTEASEAERKTEASEAVRKTEASEAERKTEASEAEQKEITTRNKRWYNFIYKKEYIYDPIWYKYRKAKSLWDGILTRKPDQSTTRTLLTSSTPSSTSRGMTESLPAMTSRSREDCMDGIKPQDYPDRGQKDKRKYTLLSLLCCCRQQVNG